MSYKTIVVHCEADPRADTRLAVAAEVAQRCEARLVGVYAREPFAFASIAAGGMALVPLVGAYENNCDIAEKIALSAFEKVTASRPFPCEWRVFEGFSQDALSLIGLYADLLVVGQTSTDETSAMRHGLPETMAFGIGRPVLIVPDGRARPAFGKTVLLCWNYRRESARAATDALPLLQAAQSVIALEVTPHVSPRGHGRGIADDLAAWLSRHHVDITTQYDIAAETQVGEAILSHAADHDVDLIVAGCEGLPRAWDFVPGAASRTLLTAATVPILISN
jgi:nucleotide-binding universal stress UspA family protein